MLTPGSVLRIFSIPGCTPFIFLNFSGEILKIDFNSALVNEFKITSEICSNLVFNIGLNSKISFSNNSTLILSCL